MESKPENHCFFREKATNWKLSKEPPTTYGQELPDFAFTTSAFWKWVQRDSNKQNEFKEGKAKLVTESLKSPWKWGGWEKKERVKQNCIAQGGLTFDTAPTST